MLKLKKRITGASLMEMLVALTISFIAVLGMLLLTSNTLGNGSQTLKNARLSNELRAAMQIIARDLRRANYTNQYLDCLAGFPCAALADTVTVSGGGDCVSYGYAPNQAGAVRLRSGVLEMRTDAAACSNSASWEALTDPEFVVITDFEITQTEGDDLSYTQAMSAALEQRVRKMRITISGRMCRVARPVAVCDAEDLTQLTISNVVRVRNDVIGTI